MTTKMPAEFADFVAVAALDERAVIVENMLWEQFPEIGGFLTHTSPFQLLVAVVLSARCTDAQVNRVTPQLFAVAPTAQQLAQISQGELEKIIHGVGFFRQKARALIGLSQRIYRDFAGAVPMNFEDLETLPGVGHKSASVVIGQCTSTPTFPVDTHVWRLARRWGLSMGKTVELVEKDLKTIFPSEKWMGLHLRMIVYGRSNCTARGCDGTRCQICQRIRGGKLDA
ncbi:MAG: endonuclease III [Puniceicoccales bacterium]|jgi:endonuclease-3|nr:endonuclease III [Puniceicoccales bacterium]